MSTVSTCRRQHALSPGAAIWIEVIEIGPAFQVIDNGFQILRNPGDDTFLGGSNLAVVAAFQRAIP
jgi:hypothetical protein